MSALIVLDVQLLTPGSQAFDSHSSVKNNPQIMVSFSVVNSPVSVNIAYVMGGSGWYGE